MHNNSFLYPRVGGEVPVIDDGDIKDLTTCDVIVMDVVSTALYFLCVPHSLFFSLSIDLPHSVRVQHIMICKTYLGGVR